MSFLQALLLGILQGITEFFPVSSSAHLKIAKMFLGIPNGEGQVVFDLACHLGTLTALLFYLRKEVISLKKEQIKGFLFALLPLIPAYFLLKPIRDWASQINFLGFFLIITALILFFGEKLRVPNKLNESNRDYFLIGTMQSLALIPGISRSASTIACARVLGWCPIFAVRFSFLLAIPTIIGGNCLELLKLAITKESLGSVAFSACAVGFISAAIVGFIAIGIGFKLLERGYFKPFAWYCLILGTLLSIYFYG